MNRIYFHLFGPGIILLVSTPAPAQNFHNQVHVFDDHPYVSAHAAQMGYDYTTQSDAHSYGLRRIYNINTYITFLSVRDNWYQSGVSSIDTADYDQYACLRDASKSDPLERYYVNYANAYDGTHVQVTFFTNFRKQSAQDATLSWYDSNLPWSEIDGIFMDQVDTQLGYWNFSGDKTLAANWCYVGPLPDCANASPDYTLSAGFASTRLGLRDYFHGKDFLVSANPWEIATLGQEIQAHEAMDHYYNESGASNDPATWGTISPSIGSVETVYDAACWPGSTCSGRDYAQVLTAAGLAGVRGARYGSYGGDWFWIDNADGTMASGMNAVQLLRAMPNWDNLANASNRSWNGAVYASSNSYADSNIVYSRHPKTGKLFVVFRSGSGVLSIRTSDTVVSVHCVDDLFIEREDCAGHFAANGSEVQLTQSGRLNSGYIVEVR